MSLVEDLTRLRAIGVPVVRTNDAAGVWETSRATASQMLARLRKAGHVIRLQRGLWLLELALNPWKLHPFLTDPTPSYLSLQTALFHHGMIEQIPTTIHVVSTMKSRTLPTGVGTFSVHQVAPRFFSGFSPWEGGPAQMASPEKAIVDFFYFRQARGRGFRALPELELPKSFRRGDVRRYAALIASSSRRALVERMLKEAQVW